MPRPHTASRRPSIDRPPRRVCIVGASGKLGQYMVQHALDRGYEVVGVCREQSVAKLDRFKGRITVMAGRTDDRDVIGRAVAGCDAVLTVLAPLGVRQLRLEDGAGGPRSRTRARAPGVLVRVAHHPRRPGHLLASVPDGGEGRRRGLPGSFATAISTTRFSRADASSRAIDSGPWSAAATSRRARARGCPCGAGTSATRFSRATSRAAWILPCSWWRPSTTTR